MPIIHVILFKVPSTITAAEEKAVRPLAIRRSHLVREVKLTVRPPALGRSHRPENRLP
jgi:hypothetical protein